MVQPSPLIGKNRIMKRSVRSIQRENRERAALRRRVKQFYHRFNEENWEDCYARIDPRLTRQGKVELAAYSEQMRGFKNVYGSVKLWLTRLSLHLEGARNQRDRRPFAYVYVVWQDDAHEFHMFRERWIEDNGRWFTRVVGLVPNRQGPLPPEREAPKPSMAS
jgi:hypothetical protein